jgi:hypothetical protein
MTLSSTEEVQVQQVVISCDIQHASIDKASRCSVLRLALLNVILQPVSLHERIIKVPLSFLHLREKNMLIPCLFSFIIVSSFNLYVTF